MKKIILLVVVLLQSQSIFAQNTKFNKWLTPDFFSGYNMTSWDNHDDRAVNQEDFDALKAIGANLVNIQTQGLYDIFPPYDKQIWYAEAGDTTFYIDILDQMVEYAKNADLMYVISVRSGPGRIDVAIDDGSSTIWENETEQQLYADMVKEMASRYIDDTLFVGYDMLLEPNPLIQYGEPTVAEEAFLLDTFDIDINALYTFLIESVRTVSQDLPLMVEGVYYSNPEYFSLVEKQEDSKVVYKVHLYAPSDFTHGIDAFSQTYPGDYWSARLEDYTHFDKAFLENELYKPVLDFQNQYNVPIYVGEMGIFRPQTGAMLFLQDIVDIACAHGWHYAFWGFNDGPEFNYQDLDEIYGTNYWETVKEMIPCDNVSQTHEVANLVTATLFPNPSDSFIFFEFELKKRSDLTIVLTNYLGQIVRRIPIHANIGQNSLKVNTNDFPSGIYTLSFEGNEITQSYRIVIGRK